jgi:DNA-binding NarL/FixJ family response regulator
VAAKNPDALFVQLRRRASRRRLTPAGCVVPLRRLLAACELRGIEELANGVAFRFGAPAGGLLTVFIHHPADAQRLTFAEAEVADVLCTGRTLAQIANLRGVSVNTVKSQVRQIFRKLGIDSRVMLARRLFP